MMMKKKNKMITHDAAPFSCVVQTDFQGNFLDDFLNFVSFVAILTNVTPVPCNKKETCTVYTILLY